MPEREERDRAVVAPGALTAVLQELARAPEGGSHPRFHAGQTVGRFELLREIARGGFGVVFEARDRELGRVVAFKALRTPGPVDPKDDRLLHEAEAAARLTHPNIVTLHDVGRSEQGPYLVLELLRGETLAQRLEQGPIPLREAVRIAVEVARGVAHAHAQGVVHRDLTPGNVFLCDDGQVKVLDFGLAHAFGRRKLDGGTAAYMAPEQRRGAPEDERTDVFAFGVILHRMLSMELPFPDDGRARIGSRAPPRLHVPEQPGLVELVRRMLERDPVARPRDAAEVLSALVVFQRELERTPAAGVEGGRMGQMRGRRRGRVVPLVLAGSGLALLVVLIAAVLRREPPAHEPAVSSDGRIVVAVADFVNQTQDSELDGLSVMLITSLEQSRRLAVLTRSRMIDLLHQLRRDAPDLIDEPLGREIARRAGVRALLLPTLHRFDELYAVELRALDPATNEYLFTLKEQGRGKASVPTMIDRLSDGTRERLRERPAEVQGSKVRVADAFTTSLEAFEHYFRGQQLGWRYDAAIEEFRKAVAIDPGFALARYRIAYLGQWANLAPGVLRDEIDAALRSAERLPDKERLLIEGWKAHLERRDDDSQRIHAVAVERYPHDKEAAFMAGDVAFHRGRLAEALPHFERAAALDPSWFAPMDHLVVTLCALGRMQECLARSRAWAEAEPRSAWAHSNLSLALKANGRVEEAIEEARLAVERSDGSTFAARGLAAMLLLADRPEDARAVLQATGSGDRSARLGHVVLLSRLAAYEGRRRESLRLIESLQDLGAPASLQLGQRMFHLLGDRAPIGPLVEQASREGVPAGQLATILALSGELQAAEARAVGLAPGTAERRLLDALIAARRGANEVAVSGFRELAERRDLDYAAIALLELGQLEVASGRFEHAVRALEAFPAANCPLTSVNPTPELYRASHCGAFRSWAYPRSLYLLALAHERLGHHAEARARLEHLLSLWKAADPDLPALRDAKALLREINSGAPRRRGRAASTRPDRSPACRRFARTA